MMSKTFFFSFLFSFIDNVNFEKKNQFPIGTPPNHRPYALTFIETHTHRHTPIHTDHSYNCSEKNFERLIFELIANCSYLDGRGRQADTETLPICANITESRQTDKQTYRPPTEQNSPISSPFNTYHTSEHYQLYFLPNST